MDRKGPMKKINSKFVTIISITDPDTKMKVEVEIRKLESGGMIGLDGSFLGQDAGTVYSPYDKNVVIVIPGDESATRYEVESDGSHLTDDEKYPAEDWRHDAANGDTRLGYKEWVEHQKESECEECGNRIPDTGGLLHNRHHQESCSLYDAHEE